MNRSGMAPSSSLRNNPNNVFQSQQMPTQRGGDVPTSRLQSGGKLGQNWGFGGMSTAGAPGLSGFSQAIGSGSPRSQAPLDPSEFPSLGGGAQGQQNNPAAQAFWGGSNSRAPPGAPSQRLQRSNAPSSSSQTVQPPSQGPQARSRTSESDSHSSYLSQPVSGHDDFPSLGGLGADIDLIRRGESGQGLPNNGQTNGTGYSSGSLLSRSSTLGRMGGGSERSGQHSERMLSPTNGFSRTGSIARSPQEQADHGGFPGAERTSGGRASQNSAHGPFSGQSIPYRTTQQAQDEHNDPSQTSQMTEQDKWGLPGLMDILHGNISPEKSAVVLGMDLNNLGLDLQSSEPLHKDWAGPFADPTGPPAVPDHHLPISYTVPKVPELRTKMPQFSDDTLFMIFYQMPRDEHQQLAAEELYRRDWRWHKARKQWMMKCRDAPEPHLLPSRTEERGWYFFWDASRWIRDRKEFVLAYEDLYHPISQQTVEEAMTSPRS